MSQNSPTTENNDMDDEDNEEKGSPSNHRPNGVHILPTPKKGILKKAREPARKKRIVWDEDNLLLTESQKSATMKIDEPKTPYHYYDSDQEEADDEESRKKFQDLQDAVQFMKPTDTSSDSSGNEWDPSSSESEGRSDSDSETKRKIFAERRKAHYNEYEMVRKSREKKGKRPISSSTEGDNDSDDEGEKGESTTTAASLTSPTTTTSTTTTTTTTKTNNNTTQDVDMQDEDSD